MMATAFLTLPDDRRRNGRFWGIGTLVTSFRWALEVRRRCDRAAAAGRSLDGRAIRRIVAKAEAALAGQ
jgi:hypothetical protein